MKTTQCKKKKSTSCAEMTNDKRASLHQHYNVISTIRTTTTTTWQHKNKKMKIIK